MTVATGRGNFSSKEAARAGRGDDDERLQEDFDQLLLHSCQMKASLCPALCSLRENAGVQLYVRAGNRQSCVWTRQNPDRTPWK